MADDPINDYLSDNGMGEYVPDYETFSGPSTIEEYWAQQGLVDDYVPDYETFSGPSTIEEYWAQQGLVEREVKGFDTPMPESRPPQPEEPAGDTGRLGQMYGSLTRSFLGVSASTFEWAGTWAYNMQRKFNPAGLEGMSVEEWSGLHKIGGKIRDLGDVITPEESERFKGSMMYTDVPSGIGSVLGFWSGGGLAKKGFQKVLGGGTKRATARAEAAGAARVAQGKRAYGLGGKKAVIKMASEAEKKWVNRFAIGGIGMAQTSVEGWNDAYATQLQAALKEGRTELNDEELDKAYSAFKSTHLSGVTEAVMGAEIMALNLFKNLDKGTGGAWSRGLRNILKQAGKGGAQEAAQESLQTAWLNLTASEIAGYDENRSLYEGVLRSGGAGGIVGAIFGAAGAGVQRMGERQRQIEYLRELQRQARNSGATETADAVGKRIQEIIDQGSLGGEQDRQEIIQFINDATEEFDSRQKVLDEEALEAFARANAPHLVENEDGTILIPMGDGWTMTTENKTSLKEVLGLTDMPAPFTQPSYTLKDPTGKVVGEGLTKDEAFKMAYPEEGDVDLEGLPTPMADAVRRARAEEEADIDNKEVEELLGRNLDFIRKELAQQSGLDKVRVDILKDDLSRQRYLASIQEEMRKEEKLREEDERIRNRYLTGKQKVLDQRTIEAFARAEEFQKNIEKELDDVIDKLELTQAERSNYQGGDVIVLSDKVESTPVPENLEWLKETAGENFLDPVDKQRYEVIEYGDGELTARNLATGNTVKVNDDGNVIDVLTRDISGGASVPTSVVDRSVAEVSPEVETAKVKVEGAGLTTEYWDEKEGRYVTRSLTRYTPFLSRNQASRIVKDLDRQRTEWTSDSVSLGIKYGLVEDLGNGNYKPKVSITPEKGGRITPIDVRRFKAQMIRAERSLQTQKEKEQAISEAMGKLKGKISLETQNRILNKLPDIIKDQVTGQSGRGDALEIMGAIELVIDYKKTVNEMLPKTARGERKDSLHPAIKRGKAYEGGRISTAQADLILDDLSKYLNEMLNQEAPTLPSKLAKRIRVNASDRSTTNKAIRKLNKQIDSLEKTKTKIKGIIKGNAKRAESKIKKATEQLDELDKTIEKLNAKLDSKKDELNRLKFRVNLKTPEKLDENNEPIITNAFRKKKYNEKVAAVDKIESQITIASDQKVRIQKNISKWDDAFGRYTEIKTLPEDRNTLDKVDNKISSLEGEVSDLERSSRLYSGRVDEFGDRMEGAVIIEGTHNGMKYRAYKNPDESVTYPHIETDSDYGSLRQAAATISESSANGFILSSDVDGVFGSIDYPIKPYEAKELIAEWQGRGDANRNKVRVSSVSFSRVTEVSGGREPDGSFDPVKVLHQMMSERIDRAGDIVRVSEEQAQLSGIELDVEGASSFAYVRKGPVKIKTTTDDRAEQERFQKKLTKKEEQRRIESSIKIWSGRNKEPILWAGKEEGQTFVDGVDRNHKLTEERRKLVNAFINDIMLSIGPEGYFEGVDFEGVVVHKHNKKEIAGKEGDIIYVSPKDPTRIHIYPELFEKFYEAKGGRLVRKKIRTVKDSKGKEREVSDVREIRSVVNEELSHLLDLQLIKHMTSNGMSGRIKTLSGFLRHIHDKLSSAQTLAILREYTSSSKTMQESTDRSGRIKRVKGKVRDDSKSNIANLETIKPEYIAMEALRMIRTGKGPILLETEMLASESKAMKDLHATIQQAAEVGVFKDIPAIQRYLEQSNWWVGQRIKNNPLSDQLWVVDNFGNKHWFPNDEQGMRDARRLASNILQAQNRQDELDFLTKASDELVLERPFIIFSAKGVPLTGKDVSSTQTGRRKDEISKRDIPEAERRARVDRRIAELKRKLTEYTLEKYPMPESVSKNLADYLKATYGDAQGGGQTVRPLKSDEAQDQIRNWGDYAQLVAHREALEVWGESKAASEGSYDGIRSGYVNEGRKNYLISMGMSEQDAKAQATANYSYSDRGSTLLSDAQTFYDLLILEKTYLALNQVYAIKGNTRKTFPQTPEGKQEAIQYEVRQINERVAKYAWAGMDESQREEFGGTLKGFVDQFELEAGGWKVGINKKKESQRKKLREQVDEAKGRLEKQPERNVRIRKSLEEEIADYEKEIKRVSSFVIEKKGKGFAMSAESIEKLAESRVEERGVKPQKDGTYRIRLAPFKDSSLRKQYADDFMEYYQHKFVGQNAAIRQRNRSIDLEDSDISPAEDIIDYANRHHITANGWSAFGNKGSSADYYDNLKELERIYEGEIPNIDKLQLTLGESIVLDAFSGANRESMRSFTEGGYDLSPVEVRGASDMKDFFLLIAKKVPEGRIARAIQNGVLSKRGKSEGGGGRIDTERIDELINSASKKMMTVNSMAQEIDNDLKFGANLEEHDAGSANYHSVPNGESENVKENTPVTDKRDQLSWRWWWPSSWAVTDTLKKAGFNQLANRINRAKQDRDDIYGELWSGPLRVIKDGGYELVGVKDPRIEGKDKVRRGLYFVTPEHGWAWAEENKMNVQDAYAVKFEAQGSRMMERGKVEFEEYWRLRERNGTPEEQKRFKGIADLFLEEKASEAGKAMILWARNNGRSQGYMMSDHDNQGSKYGKGVLVQDDGEWRPVKLMYEEFFPRVFTQETWEIISEPYQHPEEFAKMKKAMVDSGRASSYEKAGDMLREMAGSINSVESPSDFVANMEKARGFKLPDQFYDFTFDAYASYVSRFAQRMALIRHMGQGVADRPMTSWDYAAKDVGKKGKEYLMKLRKSVEGQRGTDEDGILSTLSRLGLPVAAVTMLSGPLTSIRNTTFALRANAEVFGIGNTFWESTKAMIDVATTNFNSIREGKGLSAYEGMADVDTLGFLRNDWYTSVVTSTSSDVVRTGYEAKYRKGMTVAQKYGLWMQTTSEKLNRAITGTLAKQYLRRARELREQDPESAEYQQAVATITRLGYSQEQIDALFEKGADGHWNEHGKAVRDFTRDMINEKQYSYDVRQHPLWLDSAGGRILFQFQKWGFQRSRDFWKNVLEPAFKGTEIKMPNGETKKVRNMTGLYKSMFLMMAQGELYATLLRSLFYDDERDEFIVPSSTKDDSLIFGLGDRVYTNLIYDGGFGILGDWQAILNPMDTRPAKWKNPIRPPVWSMADDSFEFVGNMNHLLNSDDPVDAKFDAAIDSIEGFAGQFALVRTYDGVSTRVMRFMNADNYDVKVADAQKDVRVVRAAAKKFAEMYGYEYDRVWSGSTPVQTEKRALYARLNEALLAGDHVKAREFRERLIAGRTGKERKAVMSGMKASVNARQPLLLNGKQPDDKVRREFLRWVAKELPEYEDRIDSVHKTYWLTARRAGLK